jgi:hypothetical protein
MAGIPKLKDGFGLWMHVKDVKELFPFEFTEYAKVR